MKHRIRIGLLLMIWFVAAGSLSAQHYIGVRGGYGGGTGRFDYTRLNSSRETEFLFGWPSGGVSWKYYGPQRNVGGLQADLQFVTKGYRELSNPRLVDEEIIYDNFYERELEAIELPFMWQPHVYVFKRKGRVFINLGIYLSYIRSAYERYGLTENSAVLSEGKYSMKSPRDNRFEYGLCGGLGFSYMFGKFEVSAEARYSFGYSDLMKANAKYPLNPYNRTPIDMLNVSLGLHYRLGNKGILAPPAPKNRIRMGDWEELPQPPANRNQQSQGGGGRSSSSQGIQPGR